MAGRAKNRLSIKPIGNEVFLLHGYLSGKQIRKRSADLAYLEQYRLNAETAAHANPEISAREYFNRSWLKPEQLRDAEAAFKCLQNDPQVSLLECAQLANTIRKLLHHHESSR